uniref:Uncharacterized protein n=1 Tax=Panagrolaimus superbus TaxID=310955 RepID=A0A914Z5M5_9BILA
MKIFKTIYISETLKDYYENDYVYLHAPLRFALLEHILFKLASEYVLGIKDQKLAPSSSAERRKVVEKLREEFECINDLFSQFKENRGPNVPNFLQGITNIVACEKDLLASETAELLELCCDIPVELLSALINYREDVSSEEAK